MLGLLGGARGTSGRAGRQSATRRARATRPCTRVLRNDARAELMAAIVWWLAATCLLRAATAGNPDAKRLYDDLLSNYNKLVRPVVNTTDVLRVCIKLKLSQLIDVVSVALVLSSRCSVDRLLLAVCLTMAFDMHSHQSDLHRRQTRVQCGRIPCLHLRAAFGI
ncbi:hypothetical protein HF086_018173 [Spodoptera exigua]|uniref:Neurotransmitter-gated ion-channel ligand-binding domain-containing protein n=1 Tax=Spodoptera exigua TaxID=7107 RepID=A0A922MQI7_SPOEX|nr:hypothetical protein HF086_018173 [Spodoptera exigua]